MKKTDFKLLELSVIVRAGESEEHDYTNVHHGFLVSRGVIPNDWEREDFVITPSFARVEYKNGVSLVVTGDTLHISQRKELEFGDKGKPPGLAVSYLAAVSPIPFDGIRIHWALEAPCDDPSGWIQKRFIRNEVVNESWENFPSNLAVRFEVLGFGMIFNFVSDRGADDGDESDHVLRVGCSVNKRSISERDELIGMLSEWRKLEEAMLSTLTLLMGVEFDED